LDNIENETIWLSDFRKLNDPTESYFCLTYENILEFAVENFQGFQELCKEHNINGTPSQKNEQLFNMILINDKNKQDYKQISDVKEELSFRLQRIIEQILDRLRVFSMTEDGPLNKLMWAHYANSSKGICIQYDLSTIDYKKIKEIHKIQYLEKPINYTQNFINELNKRMPLTNNRWFIECKKQKPIEWSYEKEWRIIAIKPEHRKDDISVEALKIDCIYAGTGFDKNSQIEIVQFSNIVKQKNIEVIPIKLRQNTYTLTAG
jgi:hypothetical protein